jgi:DNA helicase HerA-like ATPase
MAEGFSNAGVPVVVADVKGDLAGLSQPGSAKPALVERAKAIGLGEIPFASYPCIFWDVFGEQGHPLRATISEVGPLLLARMLEVNDTQEGVLNVAFTVADQEGLLVLDLKDLRALLSFVSDQAATLRTTYGNVTPATIGAIQRRLLVLEQQGADRFFGEPALDLKDFLRTDQAGRGAVNVLAAERLFQSPRLYATFLLWLLSELFEELPEVGDLEKPKLVFFFDEAHLLFRDAPKALTERIGQVVRLIRSKGVGVYFVTQSPTDVPDEVLGQLGNRVQHALRAFSPHDQKAVKVAAETFRTNPRLNTAEAITQLGVGEALVSLLEPKGVPGVVDRTLIRPPTSRLGAITPAERQAIMAQSPVAGVYDKTVDRESAYELLQARADGAPVAPASAGSLPTSGPSGQPAPSNPWGGQAPRPPMELPPEPPPARRCDPPVRPRTQPPTSTRAEAPARAPSRREGMGEAFAKSVARSVGSQVGRAILRGVLGSIFKGR